jgi:hypothetical protein
MPLFLVTSVCDEGIGPNNFKVVEAESRLAVAQHILDHPWAWERMLRPTKLWWELTYFEYKYGQPRGWTAADLLAQIDRTWVDGDSSNQFRIHAIESIERLPESGGADRPITVEACRKGVNTACKKPEPVQGTSDPERPV